MAHLKETLDYCKRLDVAELEGDVLKAVLSKDPEKLAAKYGKLVEAQAMLSQSVACQFQ